MDGIEKITGIRPAFKEMDLCDKAALEDLFVQYPGILGVINFAAYKAVGESVKMPLKYYHNNLVSVVNLMELMPKYNVKGFVFSLPVPCMSTG